MGSAVLAAALAFALFGPPGGTASQAAPDEGPVSASESWVTLVTGDRVAARTVGGRTSVRVEPALRGKPIPFQEFTRDGDTYLLPADAGRLVSSGLLDEELFNITGLLRQGYGDADTKTLPLLVQHTDGAAASRAAAPEGTTLRRSLPNLAMTALDERKTDATRFWNTLTADRQARRPAVRKVWLNGRMRASLDQSVRQIGAPTAWAAGLTGRDVRVAVLDTGIDTDHPDLAGKVEASKDFSGKGSVEDGDGHGTHVASTIAGSGAASEGRYKGVAPDARLAIGKVLGDDGSGGFDAILAGMTWAAAEADAKVVNMSLGGIPGSDGTDPVSQALNTLTREHGTLFVVATGNMARDGSVAAPAAADAALSVGSVSKQDVPSHFTSRGPRGGDGAVKPEIAAPGEGIVAARPDGVPDHGQPVGDAYQGMSGTSMASPHVAGAAAILAQRHPDWAPDRLKDALVSSAAAIDGAGPFAVGTGRVDLTRATTAPVVATGAVSTYLPWPNQGAQKKQTVTWRNAGTEPVTLDLRADVPDAPDGLLALSASRVTVPASGEASVELTATAGDKPGTYGGVLTASGGSVTTRTALSVRQEGPMYTLTVDAIDRNGKPAVSDAFSVSLLNLDTGDGIGIGAGPLRLPTGRYALRTVIETARPGQEPSYSMISHPELHLDRDLTQTFDARAGKRFSVEPDNPAANGGSLKISALAKISSCDCTSSSYLEVDPRFHETYAATVPGTSSANFAMAQQRTATEPALELTADDGQRFAVRVGWIQPSDDAENLTLPVAYGGGGTPEELGEIDAEGRLVVLEMPLGTSFDELGKRIANVKAAGGRLVLLSPLAETSAQVRSRAGVNFALPTLEGYVGGTTARFVAYARTDGATASYVNRPVTDLRYELGYGVERQVTAEQVFRPRTRDLAAVRTAYHESAPDRFASYLAGWEFFGRPVGSNYPKLVVTGQERVEYFTPGTWTLDWSAARRGYLTDTVTFAAGRRNRIVWNKAVVGPSLRGIGQPYPNEGPRPWVWRKDDVFDLALAMHGDGAGRPRLLSDFVFAEVSGSISLYRDGELVATVQNPGLARIPVPGEDGAYRLVTENTIAAEHWPLSTKVSAEWTFRSSSAADAKPLPLLTARFDPAVDLRNRAPGGKAFTFPAHVERADGEPTVRDLNVEVSYDDGQTWQRAATRSRDGHWTVTVRHPATGYASLRATATDTNGNTVRQTVVRAYQIGS
ncbi:hypothetical protein BU204_02475 [Actinophytocola xanthii]|uniref:Peptidase S8/S53 domain-containing protein n=1 Tax=Actinophytocola xanthii TaxID=1912961 RepID=A0A1Q8CY13_9PSEU|nr:hypothetical protein BU204_02475 [Actinophytocola xanthii]